MKNFKKVAIVLMVLVLAVALSLTAFACKDSVADDKGKTDTPAATTPADTGTTDASASSAIGGSNDGDDAFVGFVLEVRKYNGSTTLGATKIDGTLLASKQIPVADGQTTVSAALTALATAVDGQYKLSFSDTDYLLFDNNWWLSNGYFAAETNYVAADFSYSYIACDGVMASGPTQDAVAGLSVYTIVIDGWDGEIGTTKPYAG